MYSSFLVKGKPGYIDLRVNMRVHGKDTKRKNVRITGSTVHLRLYLIAYPDNVKPYCKVGKAKVRFRYYYFNM